jgi:propionyl-CoA synthetase
LAQTAAAGARLQQPAVPALVRRRRNQLCYNAVDRHLAERADQLALVAIPPKPTAPAITYRQLYREVNDFAAVLKHLGVGHGDRVVIYMPNMAEAVFAMLACARIGAVHSVVFGGFAAHNLALRIDDAKPKLLIAADAGMRGGKLIPYKPMVDAACAEATSPPPRADRVARTGCRRTARAGPRCGYAALRAQIGEVDVPVQWLEASEPSYLLYTSGTTGKPKGVQRDVGGYAVAMAQSMETVFDCKPGQVMFSTSDVGWAVGHSYNVRPADRRLHLAAVRRAADQPGPGIWWALCEQYNVRTMFSSPPPSAC